MIPIIAVIIAISLAIGIGLGIRISISKEDTETTDKEYCTDIEYSKECPMCGSEVELKPVNDSWYIGCQNINCGLETGFFHDKEELVEKWNNMCQKINNIN
jgi:hypothetical protein